MKREFNDQLTDHLITCGQRVSLGIEVGYLKTIASSSTQINFKIQHAFAIKSLYFYFYEFQFVKA